MLHSPIVPLAISLVIAASSAADSAARGYLEARGHHYFLATLYELLLLWLVLTVRLGPRYRDWLARVVGHRWVSAAIYVPAMLCTIGILSLPIDAQNHALASILAARTPIGLSGS